MGNNGNGKKNGRHQLQRLQAKHQEVLRLAVIGHLPAEISEMTGMDRSTVDRITQSELGKKVLARMSGERDEDFIDIRKKLESLLPACVEAYEEVLSSKAGTVNPITGEKIPLSPMDKFKVASDLLSRMGFGREQKVDVTKKDVAVLNIKSIKAIEAKKEEIKKTTEIIEAEIVGEPNAKRATG